MWSTPLQIRVSRPTDNSNAAKLTCLTAVEGQYRITTVSFLTGTHLGFYGVAEHPCPKLSNFSCPAGGVAPWATRTDPTRISLFCPFFFRCLSAVSHGLRQQPRLLVRHQGSSRSCRAALALANPSEFNVPAFA